MIVYPRFALGGFLLPFLFISLGCNGKETAQEKLKTVPVKGTVMYKNAPVANASVSFQRDDGKVSASGTTDAKGEFVLSTYADKDGAPVGKYKVIITPAGDSATLDDGGMAPMPETPAPKAPFPPIYSDVEKSPLTAEVIEGKDNNITLTLR